MAVIGKAAAAGEITPAEAVEFARMVDTAMRTIEAREAEFRENHFWGRKRAPAAPPLPPETAPATPLERQNAPAGIGAPPRSGENRTGPRSRILRKSALPLT